MLCVLAQPVCAQVRADTVGSIAKRNSLYQERFRELLLSHKTVDFAAGWELARTLGRPVAPLLWEMFGAKQSNVRSRLVLLIAAVLAGGPAEDERLFALLDRQRPLLKERTMTSLLLALGPRRQRAVDDFWTRVIGPNTEPEALLGLAARLACARFPGSSKGTAIIHEGDAGMLAAAAFGGFRMSPQLLRTMWRSRDRYSELFHRGALLGDGWRLGIEAIKPPTEHLDYAKDLLRDTSARLAASHAAAILLRARAGVLDPRGDRPDWRLLQLCASQSASREVLRDWLPATALPRDEEPARIAVAYALWQPVDKILKEHKQWSVDKRIRSHVAVALAFRMAAGSGNTSGSGNGDSATGNSATGTNGSPSNNDSGAERRVTLRLPEVPEFRFVVWASGGEFGSGLPCEDPNLQRLCDLVAAGRASRAVVRRTMEEALWRWGSHPGMGPWREERLLIRDLLLAGSDPGLRYPSHLRPSQRYFATGLDKGDSFYTVAFELFEFLERPVTPVPFEYRLK